MVGDVVQQHFSFFIPYGGRGRGAGPPGQQRDADGQAPSSGLTTAGLQGAVWPNDKRGQYLCMLNCYADSDRQLELTGTIGLAPEFAEIGFMHVGCGIYFLWGSV